MAISLNEALSITEDRERPFSLKFVSLDINRRSGGELIELPEAIRRGASHNMKQNDTIAVKAVGRKAHPYTAHNLLILEVNGQEDYI